MNDEITQEMVRRITTLEEEQKRLASLRPLYEVLNHKLVTFSGTENNWDIPEVDYLIVIPTAAITINGIANGVAGRRLYIANAGFVAGSFTMTFNHENAGATATNRINNLTGVAATLAIGQMAMLIYSIQDNSLMRWRMVVMN